MKALVKFAPAFEFRATHDLDRRTLRRLLEQPLRDHQRLRRLLEYLDHPSTGSGSSRAMSRDDDAIVADTQATIRSVRGRACGSSSAESEFPAPHYVTTKIKRWVQFLVQSTSRNRILFRNTGRNPTTATPATLRCFFGEMLEGETGEFPRKMAPRAGLEPATLRLTVAANAPSLKWYDVRWPRKHGQNQRSVPDSLLHQFGPCSLQGGYSFGYSRTED
jgi:hypothetical protein